MTAAFRLLFAGGGGKGGGGRAAIKEPTLPRSLADLDSSIRVVDLGDRYLLLGTERGVEPPLSVYK